RRRVVVWCWRVESVCIPSVFLKTAATRMCCDWVVPSDDPAPLWLTGWWSKSNARDALDDFWLNLSQLTGPGHSVWSTSSRWLTMRYSCHHMSVSLSTFPSSSRPYVFGCNEARSPQTPSTADPDMTALFCIYVFPG
ncbi:hypothetical protein EDD15DRAFT_2263039, partial [Pisolithus albus]